MTKDEIRFVKEKFDELLNLVKHEWGGPESAYTEEYQAQAILEKALEGASK